MTIVCSPPVPPLPVCSQLPSAEALAILETLIGFDTTSRNSNLGLIEWVRDRLRSQGISSRLSYDEQGRKANLFATIGPARDGGLVLSGHTDVVPVDGQAWHSDPFRAHIAEGRLHGRGACDMKGFIACVLAAVPALQRIDAARPFHLALSYDEEVGCLGVRNLIADLAEQRLKPAACIVGEPTLMQMVVAHKGHRALRCCVRGKEAHTSNPGMGVNAVEYAARIIAQVQMLAAQEARTGQRHPGFTVPHSTLNCTLISGGIAVNVIPRECEFTVELRYLPGANADALLSPLRDYIESQLLPEMQQRSPQAEIRWTLINDAPPLAEQHAGTLANIVRRSAMNPAMGRVAYNTEAGLFQQAGIPAVICGPGSIDQAHRPDEYVELQQLAECERFLQAVAGEFNASWHGA